MNDLISRQAAIDAVTKYCIKYDLRELLADIECLPAAQKWIPESERLPEEGQEVLFYREGDIHIGFYEPGNMRCWVPSYATFALGEKDVLAWMPLPEPYKGVEG